MAAEPGRREELLQLSEQHCTAHWTVQCVMQSTVPLHASTNDTLTLVLYRVYEPKLILMLAVCSS